MLYKVFHQGEPIRSENKDHANRHTYKANIVHLGDIEVPVGKCPFERAREKFGIAYPMVSAINGYDEEGKVRLNLQ